MLPETVGFPQTYFLLLGESCADLGIVWVQKNWKSVQPQV